MNRATVQSLNQLNQQFYATISTDFNETRQQPWQGWLQIPEIIDIHTVTCLDIGCGNGRLGTFLATKGLQTYLGIDSSPELLQLAAESLSATNLDFTLENIDLVEALLINQLEAELKKVHQTTHSPLMITLFGVLHHLPSFQLREQLFIVLNTLLTSEDTLVISCWQFDQLANLWERRVSPELEENDYILDWQRGTNANRYCHLTKKAEIITLLQSTSLEITQLWHADGKNHRANDYYLLKKKG